MRIFLRSFQVEGILLHNRRKNLGILYENILVYRFTYLGIFKKNDICFDEEISKQKIQGK